jgi:hypothetical protein
VSASEIETSSAVRVTAERSQNRTIVGAIKDLFRAAAKKTTAPDDDQPQPRRRGTKDGERGSSTMRLAVRFARAFTVRCPRAHVDGDTREKFRNESAITTAPRSDWLCHAGGFRLDALDPESAGSLCNPLAFGGGDLGFSEDFDAGTDYGYDSP